MHIHVTYSRYKWTVWTLLLHWYIQQEPVLREGMYRAIHSDYWRASVLHHKIQLAQRITIGDMITLSFEIDTAELLDRVIQDARKDPEWSRRLDETGFFDPTVLTTRDVHTA